MKPLKAPGSIEPNPIGLGGDAVGKVAPQLDRHVASLFTLFHQYQKHHWVVEGPQFRDLHLFLGDAYEQVHAEVDKIAERLTALGGVPTSNPVEQARIGYIEHEAEGIFAVRAMLERDRAAEGAAARELRCSIALAREVSDYGTAHLLEGVLLEVEDRAHHLDHFLGDDSLERGRG